MSSFASSSPAVSSDQTLTLTRTVELFGGALTCELPDSFQDLSDFRPVPDHQEVFVDKLSNCSVTIEILSREDVPNTTAATYFFDDLADFNNTESKEVIYHRPSSSNMPDVNMTNSEVTVETCALIGRQTIPKDHKLDDVLVFLTAMRLKSIDTEILITMNVGPDLNSGTPVVLSTFLTANPSRLFFDPASSLETTDNGSEEVKTNDDQLTEKNVDEDTGNDRGNKNAEEELSSIEKVYFTVNSTLQVKDWSLFG